MRFSHSLYSAWRSILIKDWGMRFKTHMFFISVDTGKLHYCKTNTSLMQKPSPITDHRPHCRWNMSPLSCCRCCTMSGEKSNLVAALWCVIWANFLNQCDSDPPLRTSPSLHLVMSRRNETWTHCDWRLFDRIRVVECGLHSSHHFCKSLDGLISGEKMSQWRV